MVLLYANEIPAFVVVVQALGDSGSGEILMRRIIFRFLFESILCNHLFKYTSIVHVHFKYTSISMDYYGKILYSIDIILCYL